MLSGLKINDGQLKLTIKEEGTWSHYLIFIEKINGACKKIY